MNIDKTIFLLGGQDLEMSEIKKVLLQNGFKEGVNLFDNNLSWGAKLSSYKDILEQHKNKTIYGIELIEDITPPSNCIKIDHHNQDSNKPSSLYQVLKLLNIEPNREQELISANDIGHIDAMKCIGATKEEIKTIREKDRKMQGVTQKEELQAQEEIKNIKEENGLYILKTNLQHFSPIVDRFTKRPLLLYSDNSLTYYGNIEFLKSAYKDELKENQAYNGKAFFGFDSSYIKSIGAEKLAKEIQTMHNQEYKIYSHHYFMFPFRFDYINREIEDKHQYYRDTPFDTRVKIDEKFCELLKNDGWEYQKFEVKENLDYNELVYYYDFVKDSLFNKDDFKEGATSYFFKKEDITNQFDVTIKDKTYNLNLKGITLRVFDTGIAILAFEVENNRYNNLEDILKINDFARRVYPQFLGKDFDICPTKDTFLPTKVVVNCITEEFNEEYKDIKLAKYITKTLGNTFTEDKTKKGSYLIQPIIDDRMFLISWYGNDAFSECVKQDIYNNDWYRYIFVDGGDITVQDEEMKKELIEQSTYKRWKNYGTFYGITRYSFVCLSSNNSFTKEVLPLPHMKTIYFQMVTLLLVQRASLIRFSDEITAISDVRGKDPSLENISTLYKNYLRFVNKLYFKEITPQEQGIELYQKAQSIINIQRDMEDLRGEINSINGYAFFEEERSERKEMNKLTQLGTLFLPGTFIAGIFGMNVFGEKSINVESMYWLITSFILIGGLTLYLIIIHQINLFKFLLPIDLFKKIYFSIKNKSKQIFSKLLKKC